MKLSAWHIVSPQLIIAPAAIVIVVVAAAVVAVTSFEEWYLKPKTFTLK